MKNACIVGYGNIGPSHAKAIKELSDVNLYAVCDIVHERADKCAKRYSAVAYYDFDEMLLDKQIDVIHICTPHYLHKDMTIKSLKHEKHVVLEKPVAMNQSELDELIAYYKQSDKKIAVMLQNRTNNCSVVLKDIMEHDETLGKIMAVKGILTWSRDAKYYQADSWRGKWSTEGGGLLINQAIHLIDLMHYFAGNIQSVRASVSTKLLDDVIEVEDTADALFTFENGVRGVFYATNAYPINSPFFLEVAFENAILRYEDNCLYKRSQKQPIEVLASDDQNKYGKRYWGNGHTNVLQKFYQALENESDDYIDLFDAENSSRALYAFYESAKNNGKEEVIWK